MRELTKAEKVCIAECIAVVTIVPVMAYIMAYVLWGMVV